MDDRRRASSRLHAVAVPALHRFELVPTIRPARALRACARSNGTPRSDEIRLELRLVRVRHWSASSANQCVQGACAVRAGSPARRHDNDVGGLRSAALQSSNVSLDLRVVEDVAIDLGERRVPVRDSPQQRSRTSAGRCTPAARTAPCDLPNRLLAAWRSRRPPRTDRDRCAAGCSRGRNRVRSRRSRLSRPASLEDGRAPAGRSRPFTSSTSPPILRSGSSARQRSSWSTYGYMQADVLPVPTAPRIMIAGVEPALRDRQPRWTRRTRGLRGQMRFAQHQNRRRPPLWPWVGGSCRKRAAGARR